MATDKQIAANRLNAQKSTGPRTEEGRSAVRFNGLKHGATAKSLVLPGESAEDLEAFLDRYEAEKSPTTAEEEHLVLQMAMASWRLRRLNRIEAAVYDIELKDHKDTLDKYYPELNSDGRVAYFVRHEDNTRTFSNLSRQQTRLERSFTNASQELRRIRKQAKLDAKEDTGKKPAEVETETKAPITQIGFGLQKTDDVEPGPDEKQPAARKIGFVLSKNVLPKEPLPAANPSTQDPTSKIQHPSS